VTNSVWTWFEYTTNNSAEARVLFVAARRLDASNTLLSEVLSALAGLRSHDERSILHRRAFFQATGSVELFVIALYRVIRIQKDLAGRIDGAPGLPSSLEEAFSDLEKIRHAYEHIDERAEGLVLGRQHQEALSVFHLPRFIEEGVVSYGNSTISVEAGGRHLLLEARAHLMDLVRAYGGAVRETHVANFFAEQPASAADAG
jgi:hypothetical protein